MGAKDPTNFKMLLHQSIGTLEPNTPIKLQCLLSDKLAVDEN